MILPPRGTPVDADRRAEIRKALQPEEVQGRIRTACERADRAPESVQLIAVSKKQPVEAITEIADDAFDLRIVKRVMVSKNGELLPLKTDGWVSLWVWDVNQKPNS